MVKVGVQSAFWYDDRDPQRSFEYIKDCGFEAVDFNIDAYFPIPELKKDPSHEFLLDRPIEQLFEFFAPLRDASKSTGVVISQMHAPFPIWIRDREDLNERIFGILDKCFAICEFVGCPAIVVHPSPAATRKEELELNLEVYSSLIPLIKKYKGVKICLENIFTHQGLRIIEGRLAIADDACALVDLLNERAGGDYFGFCFDIGHANLANCRIGDFVRALGDRLTILHIHDNDGKEDLHMIPYSYLERDLRTLIDWESFVEALHEINYQGVLSFETFRIYSAYPEAAHTAVLELISAIGHDWAKKI